MSADSATVFLFDVDNTLFDNDALHEDLSRYLERKLGAANRDRYWDIYEALRAELGYADYLGALQRYRLMESAAARGDPRLPSAAEFLLDYPFADRLYPRALDVLGHFSARGATVILSDGDVVYQPHKIRRSGLWQAVQGRVLIYIHKEQMLDDLERRYPARRYVMVDDKLSILAAMKNALGERLTTVFPRQGHYAHDPHNLAAYPPADLAVECIADLLEPASAASLDAAGNLDKTQEVT
ncbi:MAG: HAD family hydrolase [Burkholderiales bacterium]